MPEVPNDALQHGGVKSEMHGYPERMYSIVGGVGNFQQVNGQEDRLPGIESRNLELQIVMLTPGTPAQCGGATPGGLHNFEIANELIQSLPLEPHLPPATIEASSREHFDINGEIVWAIRSKWKRVKVILGINVVFI